jgi:hypothetical protein
MLSQLHKDESKAKLLNIVYVKYILGYKSNIDIIFTVTYKERRASLIHPYFARENPY